MIGISRKCWLRPQVGPPTQMATMVGVMVLGDHLLLRCLLPVLVERGVAAAIIMTATVLVVRVVLAALLA